MIKKKISIGLSLVLLALVSTQCKKKTMDEDVALDNSFDKPGMLANIGENVIFPAYSNFKLTVDSLELSTKAFIAAPTSQQLVELQSTFLRSYFKFQSVSTFEFGPADKEFLRSSFNVFPTDTTKINARIVTGNYNFSGITDSNVKGFPALDFLLFSANNNEVLARFTTRSQAENAKTYLNAIVTELKQKTDHVASEWNPSDGTYMAAFKNNEGNSIGSSIALLVNQLNYDFEILKNARIGIPLGKKSLGTPYPDKVEAFYSNYSLVLAKEHLNSVERIYFGRNAKNEEGLGFDDYLIHVKAQHSSGELNDAIKNKFLSIKEKLAAIPGILSETIPSNPAIVDAAYLELPQLTVLLKVDMPSALGVTITYEDNDGD